MALKKSDLYSSLWRSCDELRGGMDASQYKDYVLVLLFMKYVSDKYAGRKDALIEVPKGGGFADLAALKGDPNIGEKMNGIISKLAEANHLAGVIDVADFNDETKLGRGKAMVDTLSNLVAIFADPALDFRGNTAGGDDILGDAYEYLMRHFATESGKSKGQFYTPAEVSRVIAKVIGVTGAKSNSQSIYDPTCGSGSLLLKAHDEAKSATGRDLSVYGQENDNATYALARMNLFLHDCPTHEIWKDNTLAAPHFTEKDGTLKRFDFVVANPPFSTKSWSNGFDPAHDRYGRFAYGLPPAKNGDYAFLLHVLASLKSTGKGAIILPHGVLFRGNAELTIRREIVKQGVIKGIIGLPANLFYGTGIPACIIVFDKENAAARTGIFMLDASTGFIKDGNKNRLREQDIHRIVDTFTRQADIPGYARMVSRAEIEKNDYNLNLPRYIDSGVAEDVQDLDGHLRGGIPVRDIDALAPYWVVLPSLRNELFKPAKRAGYGELKVAVPAIRQTIFGHEEFTAYGRTVKALLKKWQAGHRESLRGISRTTRPKAVIGALGEDILAAFAKAKLLDAYDIYQHLMDYWATTMQDDLYMLVESGWQEAAKPRQILDKERPDFIVGKLKFKAELLPPALLLNRYFAAEKQALDTLAGECAALDQQLAELREEQGGDDGALSEVVDDKGNINKVRVVAQLKKIKDDKDAKEEREALTAYLALLEQETGASRRHKEAQQALDDKLAKKYGALTVEEIKVLVVDDKWLAAIAGAVQKELDRVSQALAGRIRELAERYAEPLPALEQEVAALSARVAAHLKKMGVQA